MVMCRFVTLKSTPEMKSSSSYEKLTEVIACVRLQREVRGMEGALGAL